MAQPVKFGLVDDEHSRLATAVRAGFEMMRNYRDSIARDRLRVEFARSYIVAELIELATQHNKMDEFIKEAAILIKHAKGHIHLHIKPQDNKPQQKSVDRRVLLSDDLVKFLGIPEKQVVSLQNVTDSFVKKYLPIDKFPDALEQFNHQQKQFDRLVKTQVDRLPNFIFTIKDSEGYSSLIVYTYAIYLKDYEFLGVLYIWLWEGITDEEYSQRIKNDEIIFPNADKIESLKTRAHKNNDRDYFLKLREINDEVDRLLCHGIRKAPATVRQFLSNVERINQEFTGRPLKFVNELKNLVRHATFTMPSSNNKQKPTHIYAHVAMGDPAQTVIASSQEWLNFWEVTEKDVIGKPVWNYYNLTYHELKLNSAPEDNTEIYENIARQVRRTIKARQVLDPYPLSLFIKRRDAYWKIYTRLAYVHPGEKSNYPLMLFLVQVEEISENAFNRRESAYVLAERDLISGFVTPYHISSLPYEPVFKLLRLEISPTWLAQAEDIIKTAKGKVCFEHMETKNSIFANEEIFRQFKPANIAQAQSLKDICASYLEFHGLDLSEKGNFYKQYEEIRGLAKREVRRLPNISFEFYDSTRKYPYIFATFYASAVYDANGNFRGVVYVYNEEEYDNEYLCQKRLEGFDSFKNIIRESVYDIDLLKITNESKELPEGAEETSESSLYAEGLTIAEFKQKVQNVTRTEESYKLLAALRTADEIRTMVEEKIKQIHNLTDKVEGRIGYTKTFKNVISDGEEITYSSDLFRFTNKDGNRKVITVPKPPKQTKTNN